MRDLRRANLRRHISSAANRTHAVNHGDQPDGPALHGVSLVAARLGEEQPLGLHSFPLAAPLDGVEQ
eukprot:3452202-Lingulodinium_polyedra.AAC.1